MIAHCFLGGKRWGKVDAYELPIYLCNSNEIIVKLKVLLVMLIKLIVMLFRGQKKVNKMFSYLKRGKSSGYRKLKHV